MILSIFFLLEFFIIRIVSTKGTRENLRVDLGRKKNKSYGKTRARMCTKRTPTMHPLSWSPTLLEFFLFDSRPVNLFVCV